MQILIAIGIGGIRQQFLPLIMGTDRQHPQRPAVLIRLKEDLPGAATDGIPSAAQFFQPFPCMIQRIDTQLDTAERHQIGCAVLFQKICGGEERRLEIDLPAFHLQLIAPTGSGIGKCIDFRDVRLHIQNGRTIQQITGAEMDHSPLDPVDLHTGKCNGIGTMRRTGGKYAVFPVLRRYRGTDFRVPVGGPVRVHVQMKHSHQPDPFKALKIAQRIGKTAVRHELQSCRSGGKHGLTRFFIPIPCRSTDIRHRLK